MQEGGRQRTLAGVAISLGDDDALIVHHVHENAPVAIHLYLTLPVQREPHGLAGQHRIRLQIVAEQFHLPAEIGVHTMRDSGDLLGGEFGRERVVRSDDGDGNGGGEEGHEGHGRKNEG